MKDGQHKPEEEGYKKHISSKKKLLFAKKKGAGDYVSGKERSPAGLAL